MDINIEIEIKAKSIETFKKILNNSDTIIKFNDFDDDEEEVVKIINKNHIFKIKKFVEYINRKKLNKKYSKLISNRFLNLKHKKKIEKISKLKYLKLFKPFYGQLFENETIEDIRYVMEYNGILYEISEQEYYKLFFYSEYAYKVYQLRHLNSELDIQQNIKLFFDENIISKNMYNKIHNLIKDLFAM